MANAPLRPSLSPEQLEKLLIAELPRIEAVISSVCRRHHCRSEDAEEFAGEVKLKLVADDYAVLRRWKGESSLKTYLTIVIEHHFKDYCNHLWGKWRKSAEAKRLGPVAEKLEELLRDGWGFEEACAILRLNFKVELSEVELAEMAGRLPPRRPRRFEGEDSLAALAVADPGPEERVMLAEQGEARRLVVAALARALEVLPEIERLIVKLDFEEDFPLADVARTLHLDEKSIYRQREKIFSRLKAGLEREGVSPEVVAEALGVDKLGTGNRRRPPAGSVH